MSVRPHNLLKNNAKARLAVTVNGSVEWVESFLFQDLNDSERRKH
jgi:hypothetical protein